MTPVESVTAALHALVYRAGVEPCDPSAQASAAVRAILERDRIEGESHDPECCPIAQWLKAAICEPGELDPGEVYLLVTPTRVWVKLGPGRYGMVELPACVRAAVASYDRSPRAPSAEIVPCPVCGGARWLVVSGPRHRERVRGQRCYRCAVARREAQGDAA